MTSFAAASGPLLFAHRGASAAHVENSLPAFAAALQQGADALELDVHLSRDGVVMVSHDPDLSRLAGDARRICELPAAALRGRVLSLEELLGAFPGALLNVDVKQIEPDVTAPLVRLVRAHAAAPRTLLTSFHARVLAALRATRYEGPLGMCRRDALQAVLLPPALTARLGFAGRRLQIPLRFGPLPLGAPWLLARAHALGLAVDYWVVNDAARAHELLDLGADGIVTDAPERIAQVFRSHPRTGGWRARHP